MYYCLNVLVTDAKKIKEDAAKKQGNVKWICDIYKKSTFKVNLFLIT